MSIELSWQQLVLIVGITAGIVWYFSKCETRHYLKFQIRMFERDLVYWLDRNVQKIDKWSKSLTKRKAFTIIISIISMIFIPVIIWNTTALEKINIYLYYITIIEYLALIGWIYYLYFIKKSCKTQSIKKQQTRTGVQDA